MQLLTKEIATKLPFLYTQEDIEDPMVICKFFAVWTNWTWYAIEFDGNNTFFGYVAGDFPELGYFTLSELQDLKGPMSGTFILERAGFQKLKSYTKDNIKY
ncbi:MAG: DUF2958 domain-containing protein [Microgenomates group bacterium]|jgi:hypothetical protein